MLKQKILEDLKKTVSDLGPSAGRQGFKDVDILLSIPKKSGFGDYTTNVAFQLAKLNEGKLKQSPEEIAKKIVTSIMRQVTSKEYLEKVESIGGFINFFIKPDALMQSLHKVCDYSSFVNPEVEVEGTPKQKILVEYAQPNTHKAFHLGHLRSISLGESICRLLEACGNEIFRANYQGDIGLHVAKALWALRKVQSSRFAKQEKLKVQNLEENVKILGTAYASGAVAYEKDEEAKKEIDELNLKLYQMDPKVVVIWKKTRQISLDYFEQIYQKLGTKFDGFFFESEVAKRGEEIVRKHTGDVFERDQGAIIFPGEKYGLHNRVFVTSVGNPTYEAKDLGRAEAEKSAFDFDVAIHVVAVDQSGYFQVMFKSLEMVMPELLGKNQHLAYGMVNLPSGKMSSRKGDVITFNELLEIVREKVEEIMKQSPTSKDIKKDERQQVIDTVSISAIKFAILKFAPKTDITFDTQKSVSLSGDSGPYLQYSYARAKSVLRNAQFDYQVELPHSERHPKSIRHDLEKEEKEILRKIEHFEEVVFGAAENFSPNTLTAYLLELASSFNLFYQKYPIIKAQAESSEFRLALTCAVAVILKQGLNLLGIDVPERM